MARDSSIEGPHPVDRHVGRRVSEKRVSMGYKQGDLGRALGLTFQQIQKYEKGSNRISASKLWEIANFFKVDVSYFFDGLSTSAQPGMADGASSTFDHDYPPTRQSVEITKIAPTLSPRKQKLALGMMRELAGVPDPAER